MPILETIAVVAACISAFKDGLDLWATYKKNRRELRSGHSANLETALVEAPKQVTNHYYTCCSQGGHDFTKGDEIAKTLLSRSLEKFCRTVVESMKFAVTQNNALNLQTMAAMTHLFKKESMSTMDELYQRVRQAARVPRVFIRSPLHFPPIPPLEPLNSTAALLAAFNALPHYQKPPKDSVESDTAEKSTTPETIVVLDFPSRISNLESTKLVQRHLQILGLLPE